jgi:hypothetical protein
MERKLKQREESLAETYQGIGEAVIATGAKGSCGREMLVAKEGRKILVGEKGFEMLFPSFETSVS